MRDNPRLFLDSVLAEGGAAPLTRAQAHYLKSVLRKGEGDAVTVFNGRDGEFAASISTLDKNGGAVSCARRLRAPGAEPDIWLLFAPAKRDAVETIVQKATELGAARLVPVRTERTNTARLNAERLRAIAIEAAEQCERISVPDIDAFQPLDDVLAALGDDRRIIYCDEAGDDPDAPWGGDSGRASPALEALRTAGPGPWAILIGPEGGFSPDERNRLRSDPRVTPVSLGPRILRADTAAIAALALWQAALGDWRAPE